MISAYQEKAGITPNFPMILRSGGSDKLANLFTKPGYGGPTWIMHPDLEWVETKYSQPTLNSDMLAALYDDCNNGSSGNNSLSIVSPDGGEYYNIGEEVSIIWYTNVSGDVDVSLLKDGSKVEKLATTSATFSGKQGSYTWTIPGDLNTSGDFTIAVTSKETSVGDTSYKSFNILPYGKIEQSKISIEDNSPYMSWNGVDYTPESSIDGDIETFWMNELIMEQGMKGTLPAYVTYKLDKEYAIVGFSYLPRWTGSGVDTKGYKLDVSTDGVTWINAKTGTFPDEKKTQTVDIAKTENVQFVRFTATSAHNQDSRASIAEFNLFYDKKTTSVISHKQMAGSGNSTGNTISMENSKSAITISLQEREMATVKVLSLSGRVIASYPSDEYGIGITTLQLPVHLTNGVYLVQFDGVNNRCTSFITF